MVTAKVDLRTQGEWLGAPTLMGLIRPALLYTTAKTGALLP